MFIVSILEKLKNRILVGNKILKSASSLDPKKKLLKKNSVMTRRFKKLGEHFYGCNLLNSDECYKAYFQYTYMLANKETNLLAKNFEGRVDDFFFQKLDISSRFPDFSKILFYKCKLNNFDDKSIVILTHKLVLKLS